MVTVDLLENILLESDVIAWKSIKEFLYSTFSKPFTEPPTQELIKREKNISDLETLISGASWDLWNSFDTVVPKTSQYIIDFWNRNLNGKAVFVIDGLSLREFPFLLQEGKRRGFSIHQSKITASALPSDTTFFAKSLGFSQRSSLSNNSAGNSHFLKDVETEISDLPWKDCLKLISSNPNIVFWHTWFDDRIHEYQVPGKGIRELSIKSNENFTSDDFWLLVEKLANGRRVIITSDHGYVSTGEFINISGEQGDYFKSNYKSQRYARSNDEITGAFIPPIDIKLQTNNGLFKYVLGRRKWKSAGGYPTLSHGGLSLMETLVPFIEITKS